MPFFRTFGVSWRPLGFHLAPFEHFGYILVSFWLPFGSILAHFSLLFPDLDFALIFDHVLLDF